MSVIFTIERKAWKVDSSIPYQYFVRILLVIVDIKAVRASAFDENVGLF